MGIKDAFGGSVPLKEALEAPEIEEYTNEDLLLINLGLDYDIFKHYTEKKVTNKKLPYKAFFIWYLGKATLSILTQIQLEELPDIFQELVKMEIEKNDLERYMIIAKEQKEYIIELEKERAERLAAYKRKSKEFKEIKFSGDTVEFAPEKDELLKKLASLQEERDKIKEGYVTVNGVHLKWLYEFMSNMSFCDVEDIIRNLNASINDGIDDISADLVLKSIKKHIYKPTTEDIKKLKQIEGIVNEKT